MQLGSKKCSSDTTVRAAYLAYVPVHRRYRYPCPCYVERAATAPFSRPHAEDRTDSRTKRLMHSGTEWQQCTHAMYNKYFLFYLSFQLVSTCFTFNETNYRNHKLIYVLHMTMCLTIPLELHQLSWFHSVNLWCVENLMEQIISQLLLATSSIIINGWLTINDCMLHES